ncbi:hypothetical protein [Luteolibacter marinus]|uniref:hypothetical protein n=1 Tax=Luteolibacter marinus TaxID=2776705 RepID=UPI001865B4D1|nr:hypothetical protein [Luteolibacter marinus]
MTRSTSLALGGVALLVAVIAGYRIVPRGGEDPPAAAAPAAHATAKARPVNEPAGGSAIVKVAVADMPDPQLSPHTAGSEAHEAWVKERSKELLELAWNDDRESMLEIVTELRNPDPEIREVAEDATREFSSRDAIPVLQAMVAADLTAEQKAACHKLIEWLELPTLSEHVAEQRRLHPPPADADK